MATGFTDSLTPAASFIEWLQPRNVLDIGVGGGRMGFLAREYGHLEWHPRARGDGVEVHGIEGYEPYIGRLQRAIYDDLLIGDALEVLPRLESEGRHYDLGIASDILEHFTPEDGRRFLDLTQRLCEIVLIATPSAFFEQEYKDNPLQDHRSHWPVTELRQAGAVALLHRGASLVAVFGDASLATEYAAETRPSWRMRFVPPAALDLARAARERRSGSRRGRPA